MPVFDYFKSVAINKISATGEFKSEQLGSLIKQDVDSLEGLDLVFFSVEEERGAVRNEGCALGGNEVRKYLYDLYRGDYSLKIADLGIIKAGNSLTDTYFAVKEVVAHCIKSNVLPIILGGSQDLAYANYMAYTEQEQTVNLVSIDSRFAHQFVVNFE